MYAKCVESTKLQADCSIWVMKYIYIHTQREEGMNHALQVVHAEEFWSLIS